MKNKKIIANILNDMARELTGLASGGIAGIDNCRRVTLLATNIQLIREYLAQETDEIEGERKEACDGEHSDDLCEPERTDTEVH